MSQSEYSLDQFGGMIEDKVRMEAYSAAIAQSVRPGDTVVDLGCGPGIFALLACKAGAEKVYAIEMNGVVDFGRHLAAANGFADRIHFLRGDSRRICLPERVNVVVADVRGVLPLYSHAVDTLEDARDRFLANGGRLLPCRETLFAAVVELSEFHRRLTDGWRIIPELDLSSGLPLVLNSIYRYQLNSENILSQARPWHVLDYSAGATLPAQAHLELPISRSAVCHGLGLWFETRLIGDIGFSTGPASGETVYGNIVLPWLEPVSLLEGEVCCVDLRAHLVGNDYIWQWETNIPAAQKHRDVRFVQSTFYGSLFPPSLLQKRTTDFVPVLNEAGSAERWLLQAMDGKRPLQEIAAEAFRLFPHVFRRPEDAFNQAAEIAEKFSR
jgi:protein arginine N-methyltransferase 1